MLDFRGSEVIRSRQHQLLQKKHGVCVSEIKMQRYKVAVPITGQFTQGQFARGQLA